MKQNEIVIHQPELLRLLLKLHEWEGSHLHELKTTSGRDLYLKLAESLIQDEDVSRSLKLLKGPLSDRATRLRVRVFQSQELVEILSNPLDFSTRNAKPTMKFVNRLNKHLSVMKQLFEQYKN